MKVALIGGSFNPPTRMHGRVATEILRLGLVDEVWFVPSNKHPFAASQPHKANRASFEDRCHMVRLLIEDLRRGDLRVSEVEKSIEGECYTKTVVERMQSRYPDITFMWVAGSDCVKDFPKWVHIDWVLENVTIIVYPRKGHPYVGGLDTSKHIVVQESDVYVEEGSSTRVRDGDLSLLTPHVASYWETIRSTTP
jgi:nicotinate-nucleotide adenylyltransferase